MLRKEEAIKENVLSAYTYHNHLIPLIMCALEINPHKLLPIYTHLSQVERQKADNDSNWVQAYKRVVPILKKFHIIEPITHKKKNNIYKLNWQKLLFTIHNQLKNDIEFYVKETKEYFEKLNLTLKDLQYRIENEKGVTLHTMYIKNRDRIRDTQTYLATTVDRMEQLRIKIKDFVITPNLIKIFQQQFQKYIFVRQYLLIGQNLSFYDLIQDFLDVGENFTYNNKESARREGQNTIIKINKIELTELKSFIDLFSEYDKYVQNNQINYSQLRKFGKGIFWQHYFKNIKINGKKLV